MWQLVKRWLGLGGTERENASIDVEAVVGNLSDDSNSSDALTGVFAFNSHSVELRIDPDDRTLTECLETARKLLTCFQEMNNKALSIASERLLLTYNENWREYSERLENGSYADVSRPILDRSTFEASIKISSVRVIGSMVEFMYSDNGLFHSHSIVVSAFDGLNFSVTNAEICG